MLIPRGFTCRLPVGPGLGTCCPVQSRVWGGRVTSSELSFLTSAFVWEGKGGLASQRACKTVCEGASRAAASVGVLRSGIARQGCSAGYGSELWEPAVCTVPLPELPLWCRGGGLVQPHLLMPLLWKCRRLLSHLCTAGGAGSPLHSGPSSLCKGVTGCRSGSNFAIKVCRDLFSQSSWRSHPGSNLQVFSAGTLRTGAQKGAGLGRTGRGRSARCL